MNQKIFDLVAVLIFVTVMVYALTSCAVKTTTTATYCIAECKKCEYAKMECSNVTSRDRVRIPASP